ncbi:carnitine O-acetyltransferase [Octopus bimaculoides]|uniref:carnitine O-acetyltransferase n=1 Tax=Octopus bimaculoides TaxID=37653 RepID=UPI0022DFA020|nr:carnitine O-acetyltransferase [Octopus bimaculoides]
MLLSLQRSTVIFLRRVVHPKMIRSSPGVRSLSSVKEFTVQESLPSLPIPPLEQTLHKYEQSIQPLLGEEELQHTHKVIEEFKKGIGPKLQELLIERAKSTENWLSQWWLHYGYLSVRSPVVVNSSPGMLLPLQKFEGEKEQLKFAAKIISGILDYKIMLDELFSLQVFGKKNKPLNSEQIYKQLKIIKSGSKHPTSPVGILTSENRNAWAKIYKKLMKDKKNQSSLQSIENSLFVLCLDKPMPLTQDPVMKMSMAGGMMLHGGGSEMNTGNRWFDKTLQIIIGHDGVSGLNYEHTSAEGVVLVSLIDHALDFWYKMKASLINDVDLTITDYTMFGKDFAKSMKLSPDALIQIALQLAYYRVYSEPCATYESGSTRRFKLGRTDTIRSCTVPSYLFTRAMDDTGVPVIEKLQFLHQAIQTHKNLINDAISGQGIDRHLLGLKLIAIEKGMNIPNLFMDTAYVTSVHHKISSSQVSSKYSCSMNFGPTAPDGFGICYNCQKSHILIAVSALNTSPDTCSKKMTNSIHQSLTDIYHLLQQESPVSKL